MKKVIAMIVVAFMIFTFSGCSSEENNQETLITSQTSPDGKYTVSLYQVGDSQWSFGPVKAKLVLTDADGNKIDEENFSLQNDGAGVHTRNLVEITWNANNVQVLMSPDENPQKYYFLQYGEG